MWLSTVVWKKGSMCEWKCYEIVLKNWDYFTHNMKVRDLPFTTNSSLTFSHPNTALQLLLKVFQHVTKCSKSTLLLYGDRDKTNQSMMCCLLHFWLHIDWIHSASGLPAAEQPFGGVCFTMVILFVCCGAWGEAERVKRNWKCDPPPKTVKWHSNNPETSLGPSSENGLRPQCTSWCVCTVFIVYMNNHLCACICILIFIWSMCWLLMAIPAYRTQHQSWATSVHTFKCTDFEYFMRSSETDKTDKVAFSLAAAST